MAYETPWSWIPPDWDQVNAGQPGVPLQSGQAMPEAGAFMPQPIPVPPPQDAPAPYIGFPTNPDEQQPLPSPLEHEAGPAAYDQPLMPDAPHGQGMQPGLGIPAHMLTDAAQGQAVADRAGYEPAPMPEMPPEYANEGEIEFAPDVLTEADRKQSLQDMDSPEFAAFAAENQIAAQQDAAAKLAEAARDRAATAEHEYKIFQDSRAQARQARADVEAEAARLANSPIDNDRWMNSRSTGQTVAAFVAAIVGGLVQGRTGGRNDGMAMIEKHIERDIEEQKANQATQRGLINDKRAAANDEIQAVESDYRAEAAYRAAAWERTVQMIEADQQNYDPAGTSAIRLEAVRREAIGKQQSALAEFEEREIKRMEAVGKLGLEQQKALLAIRKQQEDERNNRAQNKAAQTSAGASWKNAVVNEKKTVAEIKAMEAENAVMPVDELRRLYPNAPAEAFNVGPTSLKRFEKHLTTFGKASDVGKDASEAAIKGAAARLEGTGPGGRPYAIGDQEGKPLLKKDGTPFEIKDDKQRQRATDIITAAQNVRRIADLVKIMRADKGGASSTVGSPEYQELQSLASQIDFETFVGYGLGAPSEGDKGLAENVRGGKDISSFIYDPSSGFEAYATGLEDKATAQLRPLGYDGPAIKLKRSEAVQATERSITQNMDVWSPPELQDSTVDPEIRKRAAARAIESADTLARQAPPALVRQFVKENEQRLAEGLIDEKQAEKARDAFRKVYGRRIRDAKKNMDADALQELGVADVTKVLGTEIDVDALLGIPKGDK